MKKRIIFLVTMVLALSVFACGVQRPLPLSISETSPSGMPFAQQGHMAVQAYDLYNVRVDWDVTPIGAHGVRIIVSPGDDYNCREEIARTDIFIPNSRSIEFGGGYMDSLGYIFQNDIDRFVHGRTYALCARAILYNRVSSPSLPVFLTLRAY